MQDLLQPSMQQIFAHLIITLSTYPDYLIKSEVTIFPPSW